MRIDMRRLFALVAAVLVLAATGPATPLVPFPEEFRTWAHVKTGLNDPAHAEHGQYRGFYYIYANEQALEGYRKGSFPDGSVIVFDMHAAEVRGNTTQPGVRRFIDVMRKDTQAYPATGGWGYEKFSGPGLTKRVISAAQAEPKCHACHVTQVTNDYIYSRFVE